MTSATTRTSAHAVSRDGTPIAYFTSGTGPPLVLVHGVLGDRTRWDVLRPHLEPHVTVHAVDRRGRGASGDAEEYAGAREFEDVAAVVDDIAASSGSPVDVYGHSGGATFALGAATLTANVRRLALYEPALGAPGLLPDGLIDRLEALLAEGEQEAVVETFCREVLHMPEEELDVYRAQPSWPARVATAPTLPRELRDNPAEVLDATRLAAVGVPTLLLLGSETPEAFTTDTRRAADQLPDARIEFLDGQAHTADVMAPELVAERLLTFLGEGR